MDSEKKEVAEPRLDELRSAILGKLNSLKNKNFEEKSIDEFSVIFRVFLLRYLNLNYEFTEEELSAELDKKHVSGALKDRVIKLANLLAEIKYNNKKTTKSEFKGILEDGISIINQATHAREKIEDAAKKESHGMLSLFTGRLFGKEHKKESLQEKAEPKPKATGAQSRILGAVKNSIEKWKKEKERITLEKAKANHEKERERAEQEKLAQAEAERKRIEQEKKRREELKKEEELKRQKELERLKEETRRKRRDELFRNQKETEEKRRIREEERKQEELLRQKAIEARRKEQESLAEGKRKLEEKKRHELAEAERREEERLRQEAEEKRRELERKEQEQEKIRRLEKISRIKSRLEKNSRISESLKPELKMLEYEKRCLSAEISKVKSKAGIAEKNIEALKSKKERLRLQRKSYADLFKKKLEEMAVKQQAEKDSRKTRLKELKLKLAEKQAAMENELQSELLRLEPEKRKKVEKWKRLELKAKFKVEEQSLDYELKGGKSDGNAEAEKLKEEFRHPIRETGKKQRQLSQMESGLEKEKYRFIIEEKSLKSKLENKEIAIQSIKLKLSDIENDNWKLKNELSGIVPLSLLGFGLLRRLISRRKENAKKEKSKEVKEKKRKEQAEARKKEEEKQKRAEREKARAARKRKVKAFLHRLGLYKTTEEKKRIALQKEKERRDCLKKQKEIKLQIKIKRVKAAKKRQEFIGSIISKIRAVQRCIVRKKKPLSGKGSHAWNKVIRKKLLEERKLELESISANQERLAMKKLEERKKKREELRKQEELLRQKEIEARRKEQESLAEGKRKLEEKKRHERAEAERREEERQRRAEKEKARAARKRKVKAFLHRIGLYKTPEEKRQIVLQAEKEKLERLKKREGLEKQRELKKLNDEKERKRKAEESKRQKEAEHRKKRDEELKKAEEKRKKEEDEARQKEEENERKKAERKKLFREKKRKLRGILHRIGFYKNAEEKRRIPIEREREGHAGEKEELNKHQSLEMLKAGRKKEMHEKAEGRGNGHEMGMQEKKESIVPEPINIEAGKNMIVEQPEAAAESSLAPALQGAGEELNNQKEIESENTGQEELKKDDGSTEEIK